MSVRLKKLYNNHLPLSFTKLHNLSPIFYLFSF